MCEPSFGVAPEGRELGLVSRHYPFNLGRPRAVPSVHREIWCSGSGWGPRLSVRREPVFLHIAFQHGNHQVVAVALGYRQRGATEIVCRVFVGAMLNQERGD